MRGKEPVELETLDEFTGIAGREGLGNKSSHIVKPSNNLKAETDVREAGS